MAINLTEGAISKICDRDLVGDNQVKPIVQVTEIKLVRTPNNQNQNQSQRYRMVLSDGTHMQQGMLGTQHNHLVDSSQLQKGSIIQMNNFVCSPVKDRLIIVVVDLEVVIASCSIIGNPVMFRALGTEDARPSGVASSPQISSPLSNPIANAASPYSNAAPQLNGSYGGQSMGARSNLGQVSRPPGNLYGQQPQMYGQPPQPQPAYQQPQPTTYQHPQSVAYQPPRPAYQQPPPNYMNRGPIAKNEAAPRIIPIAALNPYQNRWTIKARVTSKGDLRHYNNARGDGKVFSFDLLDSDGGEIRVTCFNAVADQFYNQIENGKVYQLSRGTLKPAQKNFNHLKNDHEIFLESTSVIQPCFEEDELIPRQQFHFLPIGSVEEMGSNSVLDVIGIVTSITPTTSIMRKNGTETQKRALQLKDESGRSVELTLWGNFCHEVGDSLQGLCDSGQFPVLAVKAARVSEFNGKALGSISSTQLFIDPNIQEASRIREWFEREGKNAPCVSISREMTSNSRTDARKFVSQIKDEKLGTSEKPDWITISGTIQFIKVDSFCYTGCPLMIGDRQCNKKVTDNGDGKWRCDRCDRVIDECDYRYIIQMQIMDHTGSTWATAFQEAGEEIMGVPAKELFLLRTEEDDRFAEIMRRVLFTRYIFKLKVKEETYSDEQRVKSTILKAEKMNFSSESRSLLDLLDNKEGAFPSSAVKTEIANPGNIRSMQQPHMTTMGGGGGGGGYSGGGGAYMSPAKQSGQFGGGASYNNVQQLSCNSCGGSGHSSTNCPSIMQHSQLPVMGGGYNGRGASYGSGISSGGSNSGTCFKCQQSGHWARDCPGISSVPTAYGSTGTAAPRRYGGY